ncbi:NAD-dependent epimerase/dehydratase family protein [Hymenobacter sp. B81]|uniref:NAD-dependent epimerase/dehydratase family protein n=1 Tax=Hymenobacter sp. B81 TaxID=3344878 RepID=UPI0037DCB292
MENTSSSLVTCVIGGAGFIGRAIVAELLALGRQVVVVGRQAAPAPLPAGVRYCSSPTDSDRADLRRVLEEADEVIDLAYATVPQTSFQDPVNDILVNLPEAVRTFELALAAGVRRFVWVSSGGTVYGRSSAALITEDHPTLPISPYGITKLAIEKYAHLYFETRGLPVLCVRPANAFGEGQRPYVGQGFVATAIASILDGRELTLFGEQGTVRDYLHVQDMAHGIVAALLHGQPGEVYNLGSGIGLTNRQILEALEPLAAAAGFGLNVRTQPPRLFDVPVNVLDAGRLRAATGWAPRLPFEQGLRQTWQWYLARHQAASSSAISSASAR